MDARADILALREDQCKRNARTDWKQLLGQKKEKEDSPPLKSKSTAFKPSCPRSTHSYLRSPQGREALVVPCPQKVTVWVLLSTVTFQM